MSSQEPNRAGESLWNRVTRATAEALQSGALAPISTEITYVSDGGVEFPVRYFPQLASKPRQAAPAGTGSSPFLNPDRALWVADVSETHFCLLNKFPVMLHHLLIVTRAFEDQDEPLSHNDFDALWTCMAEYDALGFYNGGNVAGASQRHKHLQMVALPFVPRGPTIPTEPLLDLDSIQVEPCSSALLPFPHRLARLPAGCVQSPVRAAMLTLELYRRMLSELGFDPDACPLGAYNLLVTRRWLLLVPRLREKFASISVNALAFAGQFLVRDQTELAALKQRGPLQVLKYVSSR